MEGRKEDVLRKGLAVVLVVVPVEEKQEKADQFDDEGVAQDGAEHGFGAGVAGVEQLLHDGLRAHLCLLIRCGKEGRETDDVNTAQLHQQQKYHLTFACECRRRVHHGQACDGAGGGGCEEGVEESDASSGHFREHQQDGSDNDEQQEGADHPSPWSEAETVEQLPHIGQFEQHHEEKVNLDQQHSYVADVADVAQAEAVSRMGGGEVCEEIPENDAEYDYSLKKVLAYVFGGMHREKRA